MNNIPKPSPQAASDFFGFPPIADEDSIKSYKQIIPVTLHHFYITEEIGEVAPFLNLINTLKTAEQQDTIFIYLNTDGGSLTTTIQIMSAIKQATATVVTCLEGQVCSAGTMIFLSGHKHIVNPNCTFMIHNYSHWLGGKGNEVNVRVKYTEEYFRKLANSVYGHFLTAEEIDSVLEGKDIWMDSDQVLSRLGADPSLLVGGEDDEPPAPPVKQAAKKVGKKVSPKSKKRS